MEEEKFVSGALEDTRPEESKAKDWHKDVAMATPIEWKVKDFSDIKTFPVRNQDGSGSCVAQALALILGIENFLEEGRFIEFSAKDIYTRRSNQGTMGMIGVEALDIARKYGSTLEVLIPSQNMGESEINKIVRNVSDEEIGEIFRIKDFWQVPFNVDKIAQIMENGRKDGVAKPLMTWFQFPRTEWTSKPNLTPVTTDRVHHSVTGIDYGIMDGKKGIFIQDSWGLHSSTVNGLRFISENYLKDRMTFCAYVNDLGNDWQDMPQTTIKRVLRRGMTGEDVKELQTLLGITADGQFGKATEKSVKIFQLDHGLKVDGIVGPVTLKKLLEK